MRYFVGASAMALVLAVAVEASAQFSDCMLTGEEIELAWEINQIRWDEAGLAPLPLVPALVQTAKAHVDDMAANANGAPVTSVTPYYAQGFAGAGQGCLLHSWSDPTGAGPGERGIAARLPVVVPRTDHRGLRVRSALSGRITR